MVQRYLPEIAKGDKRILVIGGEPVPYALARIPQGSEVRGNLAAGGKGVAQPLTRARPRDRRGASGRCSRARGLLLVGLDVIGDCLTEINVTSPTCFQEITEQTGFDVAACSSMRWRPRSGPRRRRWRSARRCAARPSPGSSSPDSRRPRPSRPC